MARNLINNPETLPQFNSREFAEIVGLSPASIKHLVRAGTVTASFHAHDRRMQMYFSRADIVAYLKKNRRLHKTHPRQVCIKELVAWAKSKLVTAPQAAAAPDPLDVILAGIMRLPEPQRSESMLVFYEKLDKLEELLRVVNAPRAGV